MSAELKKEFVETIYKNTNETYKTYLSILNSKKTKSLETKFNKDVYDFNKEEINQLIKHYNLQSPNTIKTYVHC